MSAIATLEAVSKRYAIGAKELEVLSAVSLEVESGEVVAITGPSGAGKSTLLHILGCLETPSAGRVHVAGQEVSQLGDAELSRLRRREVGFVFQAFHLVARLDVIENVEVPLHYTDLSEREARDRARAAIAAVGLSHREAHLPAELSGGERQRAAIARALVNEPSLLLADEPTGNLDRRTGEEVLDLLERSGRAGRAIVLVTHDELVAKRAGRRVRLCEGAVREGTGP